VLLITLIRQQHNIFWRVRASFWHVATFKSILGGARQLGGSVRRIEKSEMYDFTHLFPEQKIYEGPHSFTKQGQNGLKSGPVAITNAVQLLPIYACTLYTE